MKKEYHDCTYLPMYVRVGSTFPCVFVHRSEREREREKERELPLRKSDFILVTEEKRHDIAEEGTTHKYLF